MIRPYREADEANAALWAILSELPGTLEPGLLALAAEAREGVSALR